MHERGEVDRGTLESPDPRDLLGRCGDDVETGRLGGGEAHKGPVLPVCGSHGHGALHDALHDIRTCAVGEGPDEPGDADRPDNGIRPGEPHE